ncbi:protein NKG7 [Dasypus novemcinctus]|uniref:protein NKG7 n=1 Tax=Dasypus novemcinctus TaxID=9361 RepID=UPI000328E9DA|nr:protein NKG7 [Dasypus novemcinctus]
MEPWRSLALLVAFLGLILSLVAQSTDFWLEAKMPTIAIHFGIWPKSGETVQDFLHVTETFCVLAALWSLGTVIYLAVTYIPSLTLPLYRFLYSAFSCFLAALFMIVAMAVYTAEVSSRSLNPQIQTFFSWSFYLGWVSAGALLCAGVLSIVAQFRASRIGYDNM